ncbi:MAG: class I SAM-dependent methyltransferase [Planctomycetaceae bacterium]|nr:class I SAM-dependent methyltransferase [Planctomycetaceae bacterium]
MTTLSHACQTTTRVRKQYERFPYPLRDPADERTRLIVTGLDDLAAVNAYCYRGRKDFRTGFRALVAGGGTGDAVVHLAHQLRETNARIVYVDLSQASMDVARKRIESRNLGRFVEWIQGSLLDVGKMGLEPFDFVNCSGVLHHLPDPVAGLAALRSVLKDDGAMGLMVYGQYGRTGVYQMQELMRMVNPPGIDEGEAVERTRAMLEGLPETNWYRRAASLFGSTRQNDVEVYDLFLHSQDRAYTIPQLHEYLATSGMRLQEFSVDYRTLYNPLLFATDPALRESLQALPREKQQAAAELMNGAIIKHAFWATPSADTGIDRRDPDNIPFFGRFANLNNVRECLIKAETPNCRISVKLGGGITVNVDIARVPVVVQFAGLIDNRRTMGEIVETIRNQYQTRPEPEQVWNALLQAMDILQSYDLILLRHKTSSGARVD